MIEILGKVGFDWQVALANFVNFIIIFFILKKFAFGPISKVIKDRQDKINKGIEDAEKAETNLLMSEEVGKETISKAKIEANNIVGQAEKKSEEIVISSKEEALLVKSEIIKDGERQILEKKNSLGKEIEKETAGLIIDGIEKILKKNLTQEQEESYIKNILSN